MNNRDNSREIAREQNRRVARDTLDVTKRGYYSVNGCRIALPTRATSSRGFREVTVLSPEKLQSIATDADGFFARSFSRSESCSFSLVDADSFEAARGFANGLVMNFASAHRPGGGFLTGASAQEESLCRCSTLYASISSQTAAEMYEYNDTHASPADSDYMLLSQNVCVFRDRTGKYLNEPFLTSVVSVAAPNVRTRASSLPKNTLKQIIKRRLTYFFYACARHGYRDLVLGAWGCGAFGNDPYDMATYFYELFFENGFDKYFNNVVFAVLGGGKNYDAFKKVFKGRIVAK